MTTLPNPYPGAKPLTEDSPHLLLGRDDLIAEFASLLRSYSVIEVAGPSGVGKSSFLSAGLRGRLDRETDLIVRTFALWSTLPDSAGTVFYAEALKAALSTGGGDDQPEILEFLARPDLVAPKDDPFGFVTAVNEEFGADLVVVFDQLEELLRDEPQVGRQFLANVRDVATALPGGFTQVVSLREEYVAHLKVIEENLHASLWRYKVITELDEAVMEDLIRRPLQSTGASANADGSSGPSLQPVTASDDLVELLTSTWVAARGGSSSAARTIVDESRPGLLHAQAQVYAMFAAVDPAPGDVLTADAVAAALDLEWPVTDAADPASEVDQRSLSEFWPNRLTQYVDLELQNRSDEFCQRDEDHLVLRAAETKRIAAALPEHLSSGGYKLVRGTDELAATVLTQLRDLHTQMDPSVRERELAARAEGGAEAGLVAQYPEGMAEAGDAGQQVQSLAVALARTCRELRPASGEVTSLELARTIVDKHPGLATWGDNEIAAGRMHRSAGEIKASSDLPSPALLTACELIVTYERALGWLETSGIVRMAQTRRSRRGESSRMVAIVHDGFGRALNEWALGVLDDPLVEIALPVAVTGKQIFYRPNTDDELQALTPDNLPTTDRLGWIACNVTGFFDGITFRECDLRSTLFVRCRFRNVTLEDCLTHGLLFIDCEFEGEFAITSSDRPEARPGADLMKTVTFGSRCRAVEGGVLRVQGHKGYGLFLDDWTGPWEIVGCSFSHLRVNGAHASLTSSAPLAAEADAPADEKAPPDGEPARGFVPGRGAGPGRIVSSPRLSHVVIEGHHPEPLIIAGSDDRTDRGSRLVAPDYLEAPGVDVLYERQ
jgi:hypothetical protein